VVGDGGLTGGLSFEGLNQAGHLQRDLIVIFNDNEMSISPNVGALSRFFAAYHPVSAAKVPSTERQGRRRETAAGGAPVTPATFFTGMGFRYLGPYDGHNLEIVIQALKKAEKTPGPVLVHLLTVKGKGYPPAEDRQALFHGVGPFIPETGELVKSNGRSFSQAFGETLCRLAEQDSRIVAITAAMPDGTGLTPFAKKFPSRFYDVGIAEQHAVCFAAGLASKGLRPIVAIYSTFLQRALDQVIHDVCLQNLPVLFAVDRAGLVGQDGATHQGVFDLSYLRPIPNLTIAAPADEAQLIEMLESALQENHPTALRYPKGNLAKAAAAPPTESQENGAVEAAIIALGPLYFEALEAAWLLKKRGIITSVINARYVKPLEEELITNAAARAKTLITVEENSIAGGFGSAVLEFLASKNLQAPLKIIGVPDRFIEHGEAEELRSLLGLDAKGIAKSVADAVQR
jgi:1-deoxy-D-xylulose-5-phosphate synthase